MKLHTYYRSSASYRVRIALNLKGLAHEQASVHLSKDGGRTFGQVAPMDADPGLAVVAARRHMIDEQSRVIVPRRGLKGLVGSLLKSPVTTTGMSFGSFANRSVISFAPSTRRGSSSSR